MIIVFSTPIHSGKTTALIQWSADKEAWGIFSPVIEGRRVFIDANTKEQFPMEATGNEEVLSVGRFAFSKRAFERASQVIRDAMDKPGWLIIDEIGPLELKGEGFYDVLKEVLAKRGKNILLVVRETIVNSVKDHFEIKEEKRINTGDLKDLG